MRGFVCHAPHMTKRISRLKARSRPAKRGRISLGSVPLFHPGFLALLIAITSGIPAARADSTVYTWTIGNTSLLKAGNWTIPGGNIATVFPGAGITASIAESNSKNPIGWNSVTQTTGTFGDLDFVSGATTLVIGDYTSASSSLNVNITLGGSTLNNQTNTVIANSSGETITFENDIAPSGDLQTESGLTTYTLLNASPNIIQATAGSNIIIDNVITGSGASVTFLGGGTGSAVGATLELGAGSAADVTGTAGSNVPSPANAGKFTGSSGTVRTSDQNSFTGGLTIGDTNGTANAGVVQIDSPNALPTTGTVTVNQNSQLLLDAAGTFGGSSQNLSLTGGGTGSGSTSSGALRTNANGSLAWAGTVTLGTGSDVITPTGSDILTIDGAISGSGQLQKQGGGSLILDGGASSYSTQIGNGTLTVSSGASLGTGALTMSQTSTNNTTLVLNNSAQSIGTLSSSFAATSGVQTQTITLNGTVLTIDQTANSTYGDNGMAGTLTSTIGGSGSVVFSGAGNTTLTLSGANTFSGATTVSGGTLNAATANALGGTSSVSVNSGGTLLLGASSAIKSTAGMTLNGGTFNAGGYSQGTAAHGASADSAGLGALTLSANSTLDFGSGSTTSVIAFASAGTFSSNVKLTIDDWNGTYGSADGTSNAGVSEDALYFGTTASLTVAQLADIQFYNGSHDYAAAQASNGEVYATMTVVPEPGTLFAALALLGVIGYRERRRITGLIHSVNR